ncbi:MAG: hypothetical protein EB168_11560 [Euryarchaeota archaeon]|nr:hypothetical protein [Euryarchaeota archaeon]
MTNPKYPVYIISKGRSDTMYTSRSLARMRVPHSICVEPQDMDDYQAALDTFNIRPYVTLLEAPFSNHGDGPGRARNWCWDHSIKIGAEKHWVMDDNIQDFYRLHQNRRYRVESGAMFRAMEDFVGRYKNVPLAGPQYRFFCASSAKYPAFTFNTRIYSCSFIHNQSPHRWRGRYNEDTIMTLDVIKSGLCTIQFNAFLQGKVATQTMSGGNTEEFYHKELGYDPETGEAIQAEEVLEVKDRYNIEGTKAKSQMLVDLFPDDAELVFRYGRWHHHVHYEKYAGNRLQFRDDFVMPTEPNNYGLKLKKFTKEEVKKLYP